MKEKRARCLSRVSPCDSLLRGFTLIELLVVFTLLALLLTIAVPRYMQAAEGAKGKARAQNLATLRDALDKFKADQGRYPAQLTELVHKQYLRQLPVDPVTDSDQWSVRPHPTGADPGIFDVGPPALPLELEAPGRAITEAGNR